MTTIEFSNGFDTLVDSYKRFKDFDDKQVLDSVEFNEYEKSIFLTQAQEDIVKSYYTGNGNGSDSFESNESVRRYLDTLVKTHVSNSEATPEAKKINSNSKFFELPTGDDLWFIVYEGVTLSGLAPGCNDSQGVSVVPIKHDNLQRVLKNPFRAPNERRVLRLDIAGGMVELISRYAISEYIVRYVSKPEPIILTNLPNNLTINGISSITDCRLNSVIHSAILERAVQLALTSRIGSLSKQ